MTVRLKPGETVVVVATDPSKYPDQGLPTPQPPTQPVDPGYGIDLGLGWLRPTHPIVIPPTEPTTPPEPPTPVDPAYGIDVDQGYVKPEHPIVLPTPPNKPDLKWDLKTAWTPTTGWVVVAVPGEGALVPTPSKRR